MAVSYTHLDVYKRQSLEGIFLVGLDRDAAPARLADKRLEELSTLREHSVIVVAILISFAR